jgi:hypothetical protein
MAKMPTFTTTARIVYSALPPATSFYCSPLSTTFGHIIGSFYRLSREILIFFQKKLWELSGNRLVIFAPTACGSFFRLPQSLVVEFFRSSFCLQHEPRAPLFHAIGGNNSGHPGLRERTENGTALIQAATSRRAPISPKIIPWYSCQVSGTLNSTRSLPWNGLPLSTKRSTSTARSTRTPTPSSKLYRITLV